MTIPEPVLLVDALSIAGLVAGIVLIVRRRLRVLGALLFAVAVAHIAAGVYTALPLCSSAQVLAGGKILRCSAFTWDAGIAALGAMSIVGGVIALRELARGPRMLALLIATLLTAPVSVLLVYGTTFVLMCVLTMCAKWLVPVRVAPDPGVLA